MSIKKLFGATWDQVYKGALGYGDSDILTDQRVIIVNRNCGPVVWGQLIMMFDESGRMALITSRFTLTTFAVPAYMHVLSKAHGLRKSGILCNIAFERGIVTCTYSLEGWIAQFLNKSGGCDD